MGILKIKVQNVQNTGNRFSEILFFESSKLRMLKLIFLNDIVKFRKFYHFSNKKITDLLKFII